MTRLFACKEMKDEAHQRWCHAGVAALCALSEWALVVVRRDGGEWAQRFSCGRATSGLDRRGDCSETGTIIRFKPDRTILRASFDAALLRRGLEEFSRAFPCVAASVHDLRGAA